MDVKTICLGLLSLGEACGYELKKNFESQFRHFFSAGYGSIYPALADLADAGLVTCREIPQDVPRDEPVALGPDAKNAIIARVRRTGAAEPRRGCVFLGNSDRQAGFAVQWGSDQGSSLLR